MTSLIDHKKQTNQYDKIIKEKPGSYPAGNYQGRIRPGYSG